MKKLCGMAFCFLFLVGAVAHADVNYGRTITDFGVNEGDVNGYFRVAEGVNTSCKFGAVMFTGKAFMATLLAAKMAGKKIAILNYTFDSSTTECKLIGLQIE